MPCSQVSGGVMMPSPQLGVAVGVGVGGFGGVAVGVAVTPEVGVCVGVAVLVAVAAEVGVAVPLTVAVIVGAGSRRCSGLACGSR